MGVSLTGRSRGFRRQLRIERLEDRRVMAADFNGDATVDGFDLDIWKFGFGAVAGATQAQGDTNGDGAIDGSDFMQWQREFGTTKNNLIAYRPQSVQDEDNPINEPIYSPFPKRPVHESLEEHQNFGPGIRINHDDDDNNGTKDALETVASIALENDLIEVKIQRLPDAGDLVITHGSKLRIYYDHKKADPVPFSGGQSEVLSFDNDAVTVFVEWISTTHGTDTLSLVEPGTATTHDTVRFHSFRSFTVVFGGRGASPTDEDGDGSIGDPSPLDDPENRQGIFDLAQLMYDTGWDVMAFDEADYRPLVEESVAAKEIKNAIDNRFVDSIHGGGVALWGYSQGGGVVHDLIEDDLDPFNNEDYLPIFVLYLDAITHDGLFAETDWPGVAFYLLNIWQEAPGQLGGGPVSYEDPNDLGFYYEPINVTTDPNFDNSLEHFQIDDDVDVQLLILSRHDQWLDR